MTEKQQKGAEMRYISNELYQFIQQYQNTANHDNMVEAQRDLTQKLKQIPLGMIINPPLNTENTETTKEKNEKNFIQI